MWRVTIFEQMPVSIEYNSTSSLQSLEVLDMNITSRLTNFLEGQYIESLLYFSLTRSTPLNQTLVECISADLDIDAVIIESDFLGMKNCTKQS